MLRVHLSFDLFQLIFFSTFLHNWPVVEIISVQYLQCCGSEFLFLGIRIHKFFFLIRMRIRILRLIFWPQLFQNGASNCFHMCSGTCMSEKKKFPIEKHNFFLSQVFDLRFFTRFFILQQCLDPYLNPNFFFIRIQPKLSDSFRFWFTTLSTWFRFDLAFFLS
jgi:hypothetical protein